MKNINEVFQPICRALGVMSLGLLLVFSLSSPAASAGKKVIDVSTVDQLYAAVNNPVNDDATIQLAPGTYVLSATNAEGQQRPSHGSLRLRPGMSLVGSEQRVDHNFDGVPDAVDPNIPDDFAVFGTETKIDGSKLSLPTKVRRSCGNTASDFPEPMIALNRDNSISNLYLYGGDNISIGEAMNPVDSVTSLSVKINSTVLDSSFIPMSFSNCGCNMSHAHSVFVFTHNVVRNGGFTGLAMFNFITGNEVNDTSNGPEINATLSFNLFYNNSGNALSMRGGAVGTDGGLFILEMTGNIFRNNGSNFLGVGGGGGRVATTPCVRNRLQITSRFDTFGETPAANITLDGGRTPDSLGSRLIAKFFNTSFVRDTPANRENLEMLIIGAENGGSGNHAIVLIRNATVKTSIGSPVFGIIVIQDETELGDIPNTAVLMGSKEDFLRLNQGFHAPAAKFFSKK